MRLLLVPSAVLALSACDAEPMGYDGADDSSDARVLAGPVVAVSDASLVDIAKITAVTSTFTEAALMTPIGSSNGGWRMPERWASCVQAPEELDIAWQDTGCAAADGWGWAVRLDGCEIGDDERFSGTLRYTSGPLRELGPDATLMQVADKALDVAEQWQRVDTGYELLGDSTSGQTLRVCGMHLGERSQYAASWDVESRVHGETKVHAQYSVDVTTEGGPLAQSEVSGQVDLTVQEGGARVHGALVLEGIDRAIDERLPFDGAVRQVGAAPAELVFLAQTPQTSLVLVSHPGARRQWRGARWELPAF